MAKAKINLSLNTKEYLLDIDLLDNNYVRHMIRNHHASGSWDYNHVAIPAEKNCSLEEIDSLWSHIRNLYYSFVIDMGLKDYVEPPLKFDGTNKYTNLLHRVFTNYDLNGRFDGKIYEKKEMHISNNREMNELIHELEKCIRNETKNDFIENFGKVNWIDIQGQKNRDTMYHFTKEDMSEVRDDVNVYCVKHILGKDHIIGYLDEDQSSHWDITTCHLSFCGFCVDYQGDLRRAWQYGPLKKWALDSKMGYYPVGNMSEDGINTLIELNKISRLKIKVNDVVYE